MTTEQMRALKRTLREVPDGEGEGGEERSAKEAGEAGRRKELRGGLFGGPEETARLRAGGRERGIAGKERYTLVIFLTFGKRRGSRYPPFMAGWLDKLLGRLSPGHTLGERGENIAARFLRDKGYKIIARNYRNNLGEIDIIARDGEVLVFVEVKTRAYDEPSPEAQVHSSKQHQLTRVAKAYLSRYGSSPPPARFDVVAVVWPEGKTPQIRHTQSAFEATF